MRGDSPELTLVALTQGVAHAPGYPLWTRLAGLWLALVGGEAGLALSVMGLACWASAAGLLAALLGRLGARPLAAAGVACCWAFLPPHWGALLAPEGYALELLLWAGALLAQTGTSRRSAVLAGILAVLAATHRPTGVLLLAALFVPREHRRQRILGVFSGLALAGGFWVDLLWRAHQPETAWVDATLQQSLLDYALGVGFDQASIAGASARAWVHAWGVQALLAMLGLAGLAWARGDDNGLPVRVLAGSGAVLLVASLAWTVPDPQALALPLLLLGALGWARTLAQRRGVGVLSITAALLMAGLNPRAFSDTVDERAVLDTAAELPGGAVVLVADWTWRTALVLAAPQVAVVPWGAGDCRELGPWLAGDTALWLPEQRRALRQGAPVIAWGPRAQHCVEAEGLGLGEEASGAGRVVLAGP